MSTLLLLDRCQRTRCKLYSLLCDQHKVFDTHSIFAAFKEIRRRQPELIVVRTAQGDAFAVAMLKWLAVQRRPIPVVVLVGPCSSRDAQRARQLGASAVLYAPAAALLLQAAVTSVAAPNAPLVAPRNSSPIPAGRERVLQLSRLN